MKIIQPKLISVLVGLLLLANIDFIRAAQTGGNLDSSFGTSGISQIDFFGAVDMGSGLALQPDGKMVISGSANHVFNELFAVSRCLPNGTLDPSFGTNGKVSIDPGIGYDNASCVAVQADGKIVAAGYTWNGTANLMMVARFTSTGSLDTTFNGIGYVITSIGGVEDLVLGVAVQSDGKIVTSGYATLNGSYQMAIVRYKNDGSLDDSFANNGIFLTDISRSVFGTALTLQKDGKIVATGFWYPDDPDGAQSYFFTLRLLNDGSYDPTFNGGGIAVTGFGISYSSASCLDIQEDGKIVVGGNTNSVPYSEFALARYTSEGKSDPTFNGTGSEVTVVGSGDSYISGIKVSPDGKIGVVGSTSAGIMVGCYNPNGTPDTGFAGTGFAPVLNEGVNTSYGRAIVWQNDGRLVIGGYYNNSLNSSNMVLARLIGPAEISVQQPAGTELVDGVGSVKFGTVAKGHSTTLTFTLKNTGGGDLTRLGAVLNGPSSKDFHIIANPIVSLAGQSTYTFDILFAPKQTGSKFATLHIKSSDSDESSFDISLNGTSKK